MTHSTTAAFAMLIASWVYRGAAIFGIIGDATPSLSLTRGRRRRISDQ
jgi:hypothetical protein